MMMRTQESHTYYSVHYELGFEPALSYLEPSDYVTHVTGTVLARPFDWASADLVEPPRPVGEVHADLLHLDLALDDGVSFAQVFASIDDELGRYACLLGPGGDFCEALRETVEFYDANVLIIRHVGLAPEHRGRRLGQRVVARTIRMFAATQGLVALRAVPQQFAGLFEGVVAEPDPAVLVRAHLAARRLRRHWAELGFERVPGSDVMVLGRVLANERLHRLTLGTT